MRGNRFCWVWILILLIPWDFLLPNSSYALAKVVYVDKSATGDGTGTDWANACMTITAGLTLSASGDHVWVKSATYQEAITMVEGVGFYGGYPRDGSPGMADRDCAAWR